MRVYQFEPGDKDVWENYVDSSSKATFYHRIGWKNVIENACGHKTYYLLVRDGSEVVGILPLVYLKHWILGRLLVSMPFLNYGGVCAESSEIERLLVEEAVRIAATERADYVELHQLRKLDLDMPTSEDKVTMLRPLDPNPEVVWRSLHKKIRYKIRKHTK